MYLKRWCLYFVLPFRAFSAEGAYIVWAAVLLTVKLLYYSAYIPDCLKFIIIITSKL